MTYDPSQPAWNPPLEGWTAAPQPEPRRRRRTPLIVSLVILAVVAVGSYLAVDNRQHLSDQWTVWNYEVSPVVQGYIDRTTMTDHGAFLFKASTPVVAGADGFNAVCSNLEEGTGVLGCYRTGDKTITLFDITDERLDGKEEVVAAHEMLHAAWDRMTLDEQRELEVLLEAEAAKLTGDTHFMERMELYARAQPGTRVNELHSIIGTEYPGLAPELEEYYAQYFSDRSALVTLHTASNTVFLELEAQSASLVSELDSLHAGIDADNEAYNSGYDQLNDDIAAFNVRAEQPGAFASEEAFNDERAALIARRDALDALLVDLQARQDDYNEKVKQLEAINAQAAELNQSVNIVPRSSEPTG